jgi:acyl-CoA thioester hydrolase
VRNQDEIASALRQIGRGFNALADVIMGEQPVVRANAEVDISCAYIWGAGKTFGVEQQLRHSDGTLAAEITNVGGLLDLEKRRLVGEPGKHWRSVASKPEVLGL